MGQRRKLGKWVPVLHWAEQNQQRCRDGRSSGCVGGIRLWDCRPWGWWWHRKCQKGLDSINQCPLKGGEFGLVGNKEPSLVLERNGDKIRTATLENFQGHWGAQDTLKGETHASLFKKAVQVKQWVNTDPLPSASSIHYFFPSLQYHHHSNPCLWNPWLILP